MQHVRLNRVSLRRHPILTEAWLQSVVADDPSILGLGDLVLKDRERLQPGAGRLDLLLQQPESTTRYEVEIQLGTTDETHIIRTLEYWDIERRRYPQYEHVAVLIAEDISSRFLNVVSLFNGFIPIMALQLSAIQTPEGIGLHFTKVLDTVRLGLVDEDEEAAEPTNREYWETKRGTPATVQLADAIVEIAKEIEPNCEPSYNKHYIGFKINGRPCNFTLCRPQKQKMRLEISGELTPEINERVEAAGLDLLDYDARWARYRMSVQKADIAKNRELIKELMAAAFQERNG